MNNKVFYQHPNLMRVLGMHETVMEVMVNVLGGDKSQVSVWETSNHCCTINEDKKCHRNHYIVKAKERLTNK